MECQPLVASRRRGHGRALRPRDPRPARDHRAAGAERFPLRV